VTELKPEDATEDELDTRWPRDSDRLFVEQSWAYDTHIVRDPKERFYRMPMGYMRAADLLIEHVMNDVSDRKNVVYAALFCYRQAIELFLKCLLSELSTLTHQCVGIKKARQRHKVALERAFVRRGAGDRPLKSDDV